ncbi:hypothetical protein [Niveispirillum irakense]|uniref:hypothetical protein n=1 Tax=Niveispirillum irakense TaxID=34011 RepID=UPI0004092E73|nr:hypothetical protein [Niveispirillum irakense]
MSHLPAFPHRNPLVGATLLGSALLGCALLPAGAALAANPPSPEPGFTLEVRGAPPEVAPEQFRRDVLAALPPEMLNPESNFTKAEGYQPGGRYRVVMRFHRGEEAPAGELCAAEDATQGDAPAPELNNLQTTTHLTAAFCDNTEALSMAKGRLTGATSPQQASFRFMVADVAKQLFPSGFGVLPGVGAAATSIVP